MEDNSLLNNQSGQTVVEYILLMAVVASLSTLVFKSEGFKNLFGSDGSFARMYKGELEYSYRHTQLGREFFSQPDYNSGTHDSYRQNTGKFFAHRLPYPSN